ncbi:integral peroxisomal membrane peroxin-domain-containing protein [Suillus clintonianus]|uniref:integral peroxisomal membrane peroxin-domain-containing protein n=1 Tax=Suillus clintonianus TaxID=1904413 RepID=UPI001B862F58|nr:integral peroxisomal membrane peroxin-domain-containing protein [Suillus clintonianus]KAG2133360.1 integral peroxisomal membrane peroxin-domain-containing protein [Suillus clintonianus]
MSTFDYVEIPPDVIRLQSSPASNPVRPFTKISTSLPSCSPATAAAVAAAASTTFSPTKSLSTLLLSTSLPASIPTSASPRKSSTALLSTRDPLSIPITTVNFRRFVSRVGPVFWLQDRVEEILMWRCGWKYTGVWIACYAFLCYFPRMVLLLPHAIVAAIILSTYPTPSPSESISTKNPPSPIAPPPSEGSVDWQANLQAIQNLMGAFSDAYDLLSPLTPHLIHRSTHTSLVLTFTLLSFLFLLPVLPLIPLRLLFFVLGVSPFIWTHPFTQAQTIPLLKAAINGGIVKGGNASNTLLGITSKYASLKMKLRRWIDDDRLDDKHWGAEMREVELWENERWAPGPSSSSSFSTQDDLDAAGSGFDVGDGSGSALVGPGAGTWSKTHLRPADRAPWTKARDGWSGVGGEVSNLTFSLAPGWAFVETEGWRPDALGNWVYGASGSGDGDPAYGADDNGWVYTNDVWADPRRMPLEAWKASGMTRRRRWVRRVYFDPALAESA